MINFEDFKKVDIRIGQITNVEHLDDQKYTTHKLNIDFGKDIGNKQSCARLINYSDQELIGKKVVGIVNLPPKQIGKNLSEVLILGAPDINGDCILASIDEKVPLGSKLY